MGIGIPWKCLNIHKKYSSLKDSSHLRVNKLEDMLTPPHGSCVARITVLSFADPKKEPSPQSLSVGQQQLPRSQRHLTCLEKSLEKEDMLSKHLQLQNLKVSCCSTLNCVPYRD
jgi:hypothetical protein